MTNDSILLNYSLDASAKPTTSPQGIRIRRQMQIARWASRPNLSDIDFGQTVQEKKQSIFIDLQLPQPHPSLYTVIGHRRACRDRLVHGSFNAADGQTIGRPTDKPCY